MVPHKLFPILSNNRIVDLKKQFLRGAEKNMFFFQFCFIYMSYTNYQLEPAPEEKKEIVKFKYIINGFQLSIIKTKKIS